MKRLFVIGLFGLVAFHQGLLVEAAAPIQGCVPHAIGVSCTNDGACSNITDEVCSDICVTNGFGGGLHASSLCVDGPDGSFECACYAAN